MRLSFKINQLFDLITNIEKYLAQWTNIYFE